MTPYTDEEAEELCDLYMNHGRSMGVVEVLKLLKDKFGYSDVHSVIIEIRKEIINKSHQEMWGTFNEKYKDSTLQNKLSLRLSESEKKEL